jgi:phenylacetate-CoA ligase
VVDDRGDAVPAGHRGHQLLVTNLVNTALPLIRYEMNDMITIVAEPNRCGRPFVRMKEVEGRADDTIHMPGIDGDTIALSPVAMIYMMGDLHDVSTFQLVQRRDGFHLQVVPRITPVPSGLSEQVGTALHATLERMGIIPPAIHVSVVEALARKNGKVKQVSTEL